MAKLRFAKVLAVESDGTIKCDIGGGQTVTAEQVEGVGADARPCVDDFVALAPGPGAGTYVAVGFDDGLDRTAQPGERRMYSRDTAGAVVAEVSMLGDGTVTITSQGGALVTVAPDGNVTVSDDVAISGTLDVGTGAKLVALANLVDQGFADLKTAVATAAAAEAAASGLGGMAQLQAALGSWAPATACQSLKSK